MAKVFLLRAAAESGDAATSMRENPDLQAA
jgi:hypothetical protein